MVYFFPTRAVAVELFSFEIHWYGLMYFSAFVLSYLLLPQLQRYRGIVLSKNDWASLLSWGVLGVIIGGRLGFVLLYDPTYYLKNPLEIIQVWHGGMSSHGGLLGVLIAVSYWGKKQGVSLLALGDLIIVPAAIGLAFGRVGNFINQELYGTLTDLPWGISIPGVEGLRHPTQLYAVAKDIVIASVCFWHLQKYMKPGQTIALFLVLYGTLRFMVEEFRDQPYGFIDLWMFEISRGQLLTLPLIFAGLLLFLVLWRKEKHS